ncbi:hypothetical protein AAHK20_17515 [Trinickia sp. YCB016]
MAVLNRIENGYLQVLRVLTVAGATIGLVGAVGAGIYAASNFNSEPKPVSQHVSIDAASYKLPAAGNIADEQADAATDGTPPSARDTTDSLADKLAGQWTQMITAQGKKIVGPDYAPPSGAKMSEFYSTLLQKPKYGQEFIDGWRNYIDAVLTRPDVVKHINKSRETFVEVVNEASQHYLLTYELEQQRIKKEKEDAQAAAQAKRIDAIASLPVLGALFGAFVIFALLLLQIRAERSLRQIAAVHANSAR